MLIYHSQCSLAWDTTICYQIQFTVTSSNQQATLIRQHWCQPSATSATSSLGAMTLYLMISDKDFEKYSKHDSGGGNKESDSLIPFTNYKRIRNTVIVYMCMVLAK